MSTDPSDFVHPIDGSQHGHNPVSADLESIIAAALVPHGALWQTPVGCKCGARSDHSPNWHANHFAHAVLAAISEAGAVEWATEHVAQGSRTIEIHPCDSEADAQGAIAYYGGRILSRITGPWTAVEG